MKLLPRAATFAAVTFCAGALANAATLSLVPLRPIGPEAQATAQEKPVQQSTPHPASLPIPALQPAVEGQGTIRSSDDAEVPEYTTLSAVVAAQEIDDATIEQDRELKCLATGVYFEARSEPLAGQLAVADVILNRTNSGRFPRSICSVIAQPGQFSFVRRGRIPTPPENAHWRRAMAVAQVARKDLWESPAGDALYFHARYVGPNWGRTRVAMVGNHIFYR